MAFLRLPSILSITRYVLGIYQVEQEFIPGFHLLKNMYFSIIIPSIPKCILSLYKELPGMSLVCT